MTSNPETLRAAFETWARGEWPDTSIPHNAWLGFAAAWGLASAHQRIACVDILSISRADLLLMAGEMNAQEMRTVQAVLGGMASRVKRLGDADPLQAPIDMVLHCIRCGEQHIDAPHDAWENPPHKSHLCLHCGHIWRPADVPTNGVEAVKTMGAADSPIGSRVRVVVR